MKILDIASGIFWLAFSIIIITGSLMNGVGHLHEPGAGFITIGASGILAIFSIALLVKAALRKNEEPLPAMFGNEWKRIVFVLVVVGLYSFFMPIVGYLISTFVMMTLLFWVLEKKKLGGVLLGAFIATLLSYLIFSKWLNCQFPDGFFGF